MKAQLADFLIQEILPDFGPGTWHRAVDQRTGQHVAVGTLHIPDARVVSSETPPETGFVPMLEIGQTPDGGLFLVTELTGRTNLEARLRARPVSIKEVIEAGCGIAKALEALHRSGSLYGPLDPSLLQLGPGGEVLVFPSFLRVERAELFQAPEVTAGGPPTAQSDVWSLGILLHTMVSGQPPFAGRDPAEVAYATRFEQPAPLRAGRGKLPPGFDRIVHLALAKRPEHRYQAMRDLLSDLQRIAEGRAPQVATPYRIALAEQRTRRGSSQRRVPALIRNSLIALGLLLFIAVAYVVLQGRPPWMIPGTEPDRVAVMPFLNFTYRDECQPWPFIVQRGIAQKLESGGMITVVKPDTINMSMLSRVGTSEGRRGRWLIELLEELEVTYFVDGGIFVDRERYILRSQLIQRWSTEVLMTDTAGFAGAEDLERASGRIAASMYAFLTSDSLGRRTAE